MSVPERPTIHSWDGGERSPDPTPHPPNSSFLIVFSPGSLSSTNVGSLSPKQNKTKTSSKTRFRNENLTSRFSQETPIPVASGSPKDLLFPYTQDPVSLSMSRRPPVHQGHRGSKVSVPTPEGLRSLGVRTRLSRPSSSTVLVETLLVHGTRRDLPSSPPVWTPTDSGGINPSSRFSMLLTDYDPLLPRMTQRISPRVPRNSRTST